MAIISIAVERLPCTYFKYDSLGSFNFGTTQIMYDVLSEVMYEVLCEVPREVLREVVREVVREVLARSCAQSFA